MRMVLPIQVGVAALVVAALVVLAMARGGSSDASASATGGTPTTSATAGATAAPAALRRIDARPRSFSIGVPEGLSAVRKGATVRLSSEDHSLVVVAGPVPGSSLRASSRSFLTSLRSSYSGIRVTGTQAQTVGGRKALATFGRAVNARKVAVRFVDVVVDGGRDDYSIVTFTAYDTDPSSVLPRVDAVVDSFRVLGAR